LRAAADIKDVQQLLEPEVLENLNDAQLAYNFAKKEALQLRNTWLKEVAVARTGEVRTSVAQEIKKFNAL
jgi:hypothetical protein